MSVSLGTLQTLPAACLLFQRMGLFMFSFIYGGAVLSLHCVLHCAVLVYRARCGGWGLHVPIVQDKAGAPRIGQDAGMTTDRFWEVTSAQFPEDHKEGWLQKLVDIEVCPVNRPTREEEVLSLSGDAWRRFHCVWLDETLSAG